MKIINLKSNSQNKIISQTIKVLKQGGLVVFPTDTVYGLLTDAENQQGVDKLLEFKQRPTGKPISIFVTDLSMASQYIDTNNQQLKTLKKIIPGPFTIILPLKVDKKIDSRLKSEKKTLGIRIPNHQLIYNLVKKYKKPLTATSANLSNQSPHYSIKTFLSNLSQKKKDLIDLIVDQGKLARNKPSTIIDLTTPKIKVLRQGDLVLTNEQIFTSSNPNQTKKISQFILEKSLSKIKKKPLIFILQGNLGVGKTTFVQGLGQSLKINNIVSPSFVIFYEYKINSLKLDYLYHFDLFQIEDEKELSHLGIDNYLKPKNILCFEWGEKTKTIIELLKKKGEIIYIKMTYLDEKKRRIKYSLLENKK